MHQTSSVSGPTGPGMAVVVLPPTARLPPIKTLNTAPIELLHEALRYLQTVYNPEIRSSRRININHGSAPRTSTEPIYDTGSNDAKAVEDIRTDAFEHAYAVRWLTALVAQTTLRSDVDTADADADDDTVQPDLVEPLIQSAAALLAVCAGAASVGARMRTYVLCGVRVQLTDVALRNDDFGSVGAQTWGSACVLAEMIAEAPARFGLWCGEGEGQRGLSSLLSDGRPCVGASAIRVLELGAGTGLVSLTIGKVLETAGPSSTRSCCCCCETRRVEIVASDFYSRALENLRLNIQRNFPRVPRLGRDDHSPDSDPTPPPPTRDLSICAHFLDWEQAADPARTLEAPFDAPFDEVFGADIVYELEHAAWINACLKRVLRQTGRFHLVIPLREGFARESATVERVFPRAEDVHREIEAGLGPTLCITQREQITCEVWPDGKGEMEYVHYTIQWAVGGH